MPNSEDALKQDLQENHAEYRRLWLEHQDCEKRLEGVYEKAFRSDQDEAEEKHIKLHKLKLKDRMAEILRSHEERAVSV